MLTLFFQVFDKGSCEDSEGREIDFKNTIILLTSNVGTETILKLCKDPDTTPAPDVLAEAVRPDLLAAQNKEKVQVFKQAFLGRLIVVPYYPISDAAMRQIIKLQFDRIAGRMRRIIALPSPTPMTWSIASPGVVARSRVVPGMSTTSSTRTLLPEISQELLGRMARGQSVSRVHVVLDDKGSFAYTIT